MLFRKQVLVTLLATVCAFAAEESFFRQKRELQNYAQQVFNGGIEAVMVLQKAITSDPDETQDQAESSEEDESEDQRKKRQAEMDEMDPEMQEVQSIWREMWQTLVDGTKKIVKKIAQSFDRQAEAEQPSEYEN